MVFMLIAKAIHVGVGCVTRTRGNSSLINGEKFHDPMQTDDYGYGRKGEGNVKPNTIEPTKHKP